MASIFSHQCVDAFGADSSDVLEVGVGEDLIEVDEIDFDAPAWPRRTLSRTWDGVILDAGQPR